MAKINKSEAEWREELTPEQFDITRKHATERAFSGPHQDENRQGNYNCVCCGKPLFHSTTKYDSGSGWPSFYEAAENGATKEVADNSLFARRTEVRCADCDAHLGHVFPDGPKPTGLRYCMNGHALKFSPSKDDS